MGIIVCPVCGSELIFSERSCFCGSGHSFDIAKEGYVNLLTGNRKSGDSTGDSRKMAASRRDFLNKGYFSPLKDMLTDYIASNCGDGAGLDICCGEGWYTDSLGGRERYGFDLSREMVRLAAKRKNGVSFVSNISSIPIKSGSVAAAIHLFAPFHNSEFSRIMSEDGILLTAVAGEDHLMAIKRLLYDSPYKNDEAPPDAPGFRICEKLKVSANILLPAADVAALLNMTPYGVHSSARGRERLASAGDIVTELEFVVFAMKKI